MRSVKHFSLNINKWAQEKIQKFIKTVENDVKDSASAWEKTLEQALGKQIPKWENFSGRTIDRNRLFPYRRKGKLQDSVKVNVGVYEGKTKTTIRIIGSVRAKHAKYTNTRGNGKWTGWLDDVFRGSTRGNVKSLTETFKELVQARRNL